MLFVNGSICSGNTSDLKVPVDISYKKTAPFVPIQILSFESAFKVNAARKSKVDDNTARMQSIKQLGV